MTIATLLLCRTEAKSLEFQKAVEKRLGRIVETVISPSFRIEELDVQPAEEIYDHLIFTSSNGAVQAKRLGLRSACTVFCVGSGTSLKAKDLGYEILDAGSDVKELASVIQAQKIKGSLLHVSGEHVAGDLVGNLVKANLNATRLVAYRQVQMPATSGFLDCIATEAPKVLPFFSQRATLILEDVKIGSNTHMVAMSDRVADCLNQKYKLSISIAKAPNLHAMLDATCAKLVL